jgi:hypothetical protein
MNAKPQSASTMIPTPQPAAAGAEFAAALAGASSEQLPLVPAGWYPMAAFPKNCQRVQALMKDGTIHPDVHWASDLSGEEQPAFEGYFIPSGSGFVEIAKPIAWRKKQ